MIVVTMGYADYVMTTEDGFILSELLGRAERYESKYRGGGIDNTFHVYPNETAFSVKVISDDIYRIAKLAGKPIEENSK